MKQGLIWWYLSGIIMSLVFAWGSLMDLFHREPVCLDSQESDSTELFPSTLSGKVVMGLGFLTPLVVAIAILVIGIMLMAKA